MKHGFGSDSHENDSFVLRPLPTRAERHALSAGAALPEPPGHFHLLLISVLAAGIGIGAGFIAFFLYRMIGFFTNLCFYGRISTAMVSPRENQLGISILAVTTLGGLIVGLLARFGSSKIKGHGIPEAMEAVLINKSRISPRVGVLKPLSAGIAIGSGGPFGAEGPIIQTGGALGSVIGQVLHTTGAERKVLLACGAAAGMSATFGTPIASVLLAIQLLLFEFKSRSFIPLVIASTLAASIHMSLLGRGPMFEVSALNYGVPSQLPLYAGLGVICGLAAVGFSSALYFFEDLFEHLPIDPCWCPAIGGFALGVIGMFFPRVLGVGYDTITDILNSNLGVQVLLGVMIFKSLALLITIGSGTSGGLLAPMFMIGAALGASYSRLMQMLLPSMHLAAGAYAVVGMAALFGAASRASFAFFIFAFEITRDYNAVLPLMTVSVIADGVALSLSRNSIMTEKLARRGLKVHQDYEPDVLSQLSVVDVMDREVQTVPADMLAAELSERIAHHDPELTHSHAFPIVTDDRVVGIVTRGDLLRSSSAPTNDTVLEAGAANPVVTYPHEGLDEAAAKMLWNDVGRLPVVKDREDSTLVGYIDRGTLLRARYTRLEAERVRDIGWISRLTTHFTADRKLS